MTVINVRVDYLQNTHLVGTRTLNRLFKGINDYGEYSAIWHGLTYHNANQALVSVTGVDKGLCIVEVYRVTKATRFRNLPVLQYKLKTKKY